MPSKSLRTCALEAHVNMFLAHVKFWLRILVTEEDPCSSLRQVFSIVVVLQHEGLACMTVYYKLSGKIAESFFESVAIKRRFLQRSCLLHVQTNNRWMGFMPRDATLARGMHWNVCV